MRRLPLLLIGLGLLCPTAALAATPAPLDAGEIAAAHVLKSAPVFTDPTAEAAPAVTPNKIRAIIGTEPIKIAIMPAAALPAGQDADDVATAVLAATHHPESVLFVLIGRAFGAAAGSTSGLSTDQVTTIAKAAFAAHQAGGFTRDNIEAVLEDSATQAKGALIAAPSVAPSPAATGGDDSSDTTHKDPPAWLVVGAVIIVVVVVFTVAIMSRLSRRQAAAWDPEPEPVAPEPAAEEAPEPEPLVEPEPEPVAPPAPPAPVWAWTGGEWEQHEIVEV